MVHIVKGTKDIYGDELNLWLYVEDKIRQVCNNYYAKEIRTPIFEHTELFVKSTGDTTDVVQKEMYTFIDKGKRSITLKPEGTPPAVRLFIENSLYAGALPSKLFYISPFFRYENTQHGRMRQFHQFGLECFGSYSAAADAEVIAVVHEILENLGIKNTKLHINSIGYPSSRLEYNEKLREFAAKNLEELCPTCKERYDKNPLRMLDCKIEKCKAIFENAPSTLDSLDEESKEHFEDLQKILKSLDIDFVINDRIVRGLDYYTRTVFEFICDDIGAQSTVCGGGRYDGLLEKSGAPAMGAVGFGMGLERIILAMKAQGLAEIPKQQPSVFLGYIGDAGYYEAQKLAYLLRKSGISTETDNLKRSVKAQLKYANKINAKYSLVLGDNEIETGKANLKNMETGEQTPVDLGSMESLINIIIKGAK